MGVASGKDTLVVNLFAGPSTGKSSTMAGVFSEIKWRGIDAEMAPEYAKEKVWEESYKVLENQIYIFGKQLHTIHRLIGKVDCVITDSPLLLSLIYGRHMTKAFHDLVLETFNSHRTLNIFLNRKKKYNPNGRMQTSEEACLIDDEIKQMLINNEIEFVEIDSEPKSTEIIANMIQLGIKGLR